MSETNDLSITELRRALQLLLDAVESKFGSELTFNVDHYWTPATPFDVYDQSPELTIGQVADDVDSVQRLASSAAGGDNELIIWHEAEHIAGILRAVAKLDLA